MPRVEQSIATLLVLDKYIGGRLYADTVDRYMSQDKEISGLEELPVKSMGTDPPVSGKNKNVQYIVPTYRSG